MPRTAREEGEGWRSTWRGGSRQEQKGLKKIEGKGAVINTNEKIIQGYIFTHLYWEKIRGGGGLVGWGGWGGGIWYPEIGLPGSMSSGATLLRFSAGPDELTGAGSRWGGGDLFRQYSARLDLKIMMR